MMRKKSTNFILIALLLISINTYGAEIPAEPEAKHVESTAHFLKDILPTKVLQEILLQYHGDYYKTRKTIKTNMQIVQTMFNRHNGLYALHYYDSQFYVGYYKIPSGRLLDVRITFFKNRAYQEPSYAGGKKYIDIDLICNEAIARNGRHGYIAKLDYDENNVVPFPGDASRKAYILKGDVLNGNAHRTTITLLAKTNYIKQLARELGITLKRPAAQEIS